MGDIQQRLRVLAGAARYDASCASGRAGARDSGRPPPAGVCHSWSDDGRCISLLKILLSNHCIYDCAYCANRASATVDRATFTPEEIAELTMHFYRRNYIEGLFLSSGVLRSPDYTMELMIRTAELLRREHGFRGYLHMKAIPGASEALLQRAGLLADRVSVNIELPTEVSLRALAPDKKREDILRPMDRLHTAIENHRAARKRDRKTPRFSPSGQSTQLIVGASPEPDRQILTLADALYRKYGLRRVYYSAFMPVSDDPRLPHPSGADLLREHRLYQADWLVRLYGFGPEEVLEPGTENLDRELDPKTAWALRHPECFPVRVQQAPLEELVRVPGLGLISARRIIAARRHAQLSVEDLTRIGVVMKRARYFIECSGVPAACRRWNAERVRAELLARRPAPASSAGVQGELAFAGAAG
ncbi:MAG: putative DNA modification/repair radical SAM protein [Kiritimatiellae bacterium]|nr:putative DNA modification/repair radical SAM protein [Kiritimatiellia bacterium]